MNAPLGLGSRRTFRHTDGHAPHALPRSVDVAIVGAGVIGLSIGWRLAARGMTVGVLDRGRAGEGTSLAATGMLAAAAEFEPGGAELLPLALESQRMWPGFRDALQSASRIDIDYQDTGTLLVAAGRDEVERLRAKHAFQARAGLRTQLLGGAEVRAREGGLRPSVTAGIFCPDDHQVDPVRVVAALRRAFIEAGGILVEGCDVADLEFSGGRACGVLTRSGPCGANITILAAGAWSGAAGRAAGLDIPVRPLKGQALSLRPTAASGTIDHVVWTEQIHMAPKGDGSLVVGATMEECGFDETISAGGVFALLEAVRRVLPGVEEMRLEAVWAGFRPTSLDDAPILGRTGMDGLLLATGHHRNGYLLAPVTAAAIADLVTEGELPAVARPFGLTRFAATDAAQVLEKVACN